MRLIDADALSNALYHEAFETDSDMQKWDSGCWIRYKMFENAIEKAPTIEERKTGKWQITDAYPHNVYCSECHKKFAQTHWAVWNDEEEPLQRNYCPHCGAKMEGGSKEE